MTDATDIALASSADPSTFLASTDTLLRLIEAQLLAMPLVAAMALEVLAYDGECLRLQAPLAANINDKGCAFGGSLTSLMTLAGWGLVSARLRDAGLDAEVYVANSHIRYRAPLYADLSAEAELAEGESWQRFFATLRRRGKARLDVVAKIALPEGGIATEGRSRYVAVRPMRGG